MRKTLGPSDGSPAAGRTLVNFVTGGTDDARAIAAWANAAGAPYLDGAILGYPRDVGASETVVLYGAAETAFREQKASLAPIAGSHRFIGDRPEGPNLVSAALFMQHFASLSGLFEAGTLAAQPGLSMREFTDMVNELMVPLFQEGSADVARRLEDGDFRGDQASIDVYVAGVGDGSRCCAALDFESSVGASSGSFPCRNSSVGPRLRPSACSDHDVGTPP
ncbi:hypothetical protein DSM104329_02024 [Capillimicrobium parvum]|uniref:Uncharacterized protein n=1 Tax=Capillimicrobium parvum TaxID=2884022 RepID=A0A9E6XWA9_9ACTN|nr:hypothetical protein DSM104329_02024 [Capillimicrobium parvum]